MRRTRITVRIESYGPVGTAFLSESAQMTHEGGPDEILNLTGHVVEMVKATKQRLLAEMTRYVEAHGSFGTPLSIHDIVTVADGPKAAV